MKSSLTGILFAFAALAATGGPVEFRSSDRQTALVELYTSEGCSSCPPAEVWLSKLKKEPGLWSEFVPAAFHVDYWNHLGWKDPWSDKQYSDRQRDYADKWGGDSVYTPGFVLNGKEWRNWFGLRGAPGLSGAKIGVLKAMSEDGRRWRATFAPVAAQNDGYEVHAALLVCDLASEVKAGENSGRRLEHDFVVVRLVRGSMSGKDGEFAGNFALEAGPGPAKGRTAAAVWITRAGAVEPLQSTGGWLPQAGTSTQ